MSPKAVVSAANPLLVLAAASLALQPGCATLFGWNIHAPGMLSVNFADKVEPMRQRVALYLDPAVYDYISKDKGNWAADPTTFYIGEAYAPMLLEGFQQAFDEFILMEAEPDTSIMKQYGIPYLAVVRIKDFQNRMTWKGQGVGLVTETVIYDMVMNRRDYFESRGTSDVEKVFAKKGGPEVNLNAALENNIAVLIQYMQDSLRSNKWV